MFPQFFQRFVVEDTHNILDKPGNSSQSYRLIKFINSKEIVDLSEILKAYIFQAIEVEKLGLKVEFKKNPEPIPDELQKKFEEFTSLKNAFYALTPGRQRGYIIYFSQPKQSRTREGRIEKCMQKILNGEGLNDN